MARGGARPGAGRKAKQTVQSNIRLTEVEIAILKEMCAKTGKSKSEFIRDLIRDSCK
jgi:hypothetical protein